MWVRQCDLDAGAEDLAADPGADRLQRGVHPAAAVGRAEGVRGAPGRDQRARREAAGASRRDFLRTGSGMAAALLALNQVFGDCYEVDADEVERPQGVRGEMAEGPVHLRRADPPRRRQPQVVRRHADGRATKSFFQLLRPEAKTRGGSAGAAQPRPLRQGGLRRQRHGHGDHQRRAEPRLGQEPAAARPDGRHARSSSTTWPARGASSRTACCAPTSAPGNSTRWSGRSRT